MYWNARFLSAKVRADKQFGMVLQAIREVQVQSNVDIAAASSEHELRNPRVDWEDVQINISKVFQAISGKHFNGCEDVKEALRVIIDQQSVKA